MKLFNEKGFSLTSTMVATGIVGVMALGIMRITEQGYKGSSDLTARQEIRDLRDEFYVAMRSNSCGLINPEEGKPISEKKWKFDMSDPKKMVFTKLYSRFGQEFKPGTQYGKLKIAENNPFSIGPIGRNSPFLQDFPEDSKPDGSYYHKLSDSEFAAQLTITLTKPISAGKGRNGEGVEAPIHFLVILEINDKDEIIGCKTISQLSAAKESCDTFESAGGVMEFEWDPNENKCIVTINVNELASDGIYETDNPGNVDPKIYVLSQIPDKG